MISSKGWYVVRYETFDELLPVDDAKEHYKGDECWCMPIIDRIPGMLPRIAHYAADGRE